MAKIISFYDRIPMSTLAEIIKRQNQTPKKPKKQKRKPYIEGVPF
jgi:hypothetical protein